MAVDDSCDIDSMTQLVQSHVSGAKLAGGHGNELRYTLPLDRVNQFAGKIFTFNVSVISLHTIVVQNMKLCLQSVGFHVDIGIEFT